MWCEYWCIKNRKHRACRHADVAPKRSMAVIEETFNGTFIGLLNYNHVIVLCL